MNWHQSNSIGCSVSRTAMLKSALVLPKRPDLASATTLGRGRTAKGFWPMTMKAYVRWLSQTVAHGGGEKGSWSRDAAKMAFGIYLAVVVLVFLPFMAQADGHIYWTDAGAKKIQRANLDGSDIVDLISGSGLLSPNGIALDVEGGKMYWVDPDAQKIRRANLDGSQMEDLPVGSVGPVAIALDIAGGKMYWADYSVSGYIQRANLDGSGVENLVTVVGDREGIALDTTGGKMYWTSSTLQLIQRANLDGSGVESLITTGLSRPRGIALDLKAGKMYWTDVLAHKIQRSNLDGSGVEDLVTGLGNPAGIALDVVGGKMYWTDILTHKIQRANLDGSNIEDLVTGLSIPADIALELGPRQVTIDIKPGGDPNSINPRDQGRIPVAILSTADFDATTVDAGTVRFGATGTEATARHSAVEDVNGDGKPDMIFQFETQATGIKCGDAQAFLTGFTIGGQAIAGSDSIQTVGCY